MCVLWGRKAGDLGQSSRFQELPATLSGRPSPGAPELEGPTGLRDMGSGSIRLATAAAPRAYPTWRARLRRGEKRRGAGGAGFQLSLAGLLPRSAALRSPPARSPGRFQSWPAPPLAPARPQPLPRSSPLRISRSQPGLRLPPDSCTARCPAPPAPGSLPGFRPGAVHRVVLNPRALPLCAGAGAYQPPPPLGQTACSPQSSRHGTRG